MTGEGDSGPAGSGPESSAHLPENPDGTDIDAALNYCIAHAEAEGIALQEALNRLGPASFCFVCLVMGIPFIQPLPLGPYTMASGITFILAGWQMSHGHATPSLPAKMQGVRIHGRGWLAVLRFCQKMLRFCRRFTRPRREEWVTGEAGTRLVGRLIFIGGILLAVPVANLPFNNSLPALMILFAALAWLERDGLMIFVSLFWGALSLVYFVVVLVAIWFFGSQIFEWVKGAWPDFNA